VDRCLALAQAIVFKNRFIVIGRRPLPPSSPPLAAAYFDWLSAA